MAIALLDKQPFWFRGHANFARSRRWGITVTVSALLVLLLFLSAPKDHVLRPSTAHVKVQAPLVLCRRPADADSAQQIWHSIVTAPSESNSTEPYLRDATRPGAVVQDPSRAVDLEDSFVNFTRKPECNLSSMELHDPFHPLCSERSQLMTALTDGGRQGIDAPYSPRGCDMRWYTTSELCRILSKFDQINVIGDSMERYLAVSMHILLRMDLDNGGRTGWIEDPEGVDCHCFAGFSTGKCMFHSAFSSTVVWAYDPDSMACPRAESALIECQYSPFPPPTFCRAIAYLSHRRQIPPSAVIPSTTASIPWPSFSPKPARQSRTPS